jgi:hypothetical protein
MSKIYIVPIEPIDTRYTRQWYEHIPASLEAEAKKTGREIEIVVVDGEQVPPVPTPGAFLDFGATNIYKSSQLGAIAEEFQHGRVKPGDKFLFTDAWNPSVISVRYMSELLNIPVKLHGMWHAGSYDPQDFLGRLIGGASWVRHAEKAMMHAYDTNWFATNFHLDMFIRNLWGPFTKEAFEPSFDETKAKWMVNRKVDLTGWPMDYLKAVLDPYSKMKKTNRIAFPHRLAPEKQLNIFTDLAARMPEYEWIVCQEKELSKHEYHTILGESKMVFSANLQETYGISMIEGLICGSMPLVPNRLSYIEMYEEAFKYPDAWTRDFASYESNRDDLIGKIRSIMEYSESDYMKSIMSSQLAMLDRYIRATPLMNALLS